MDPIAAVAAAAVAALVLSAGALWFTACTSAAAGRSATASEASARAAGESIEIARTARHREDVPTFKLTPGQPQNFALPVTITVVSGPPRINVTTVFHSTSEAAPQISAGAAVLAAQVTLTVGGDSHQGEVQSPRALINGDDFVVDADCVADPMRVDVEVWLLSTDANDPTRQWHRKERVRWPA